MIQDSLRPQELLPLKLQLLLPEHLLFLQAHLLFMCLPIAE